MLAALLVVLPALGACSAAPGPSVAATGGAGSPSGASGGPSVGPADATAIIQATRLADPASVEALEQVRLTAVGTAAAADLLAHGVSGDARWAATYVYASGGTDPAPLRPIAIDPSASASVRAMAAAGLVGMGDVSGFEPLIASLTTTDPMDGADPAGTVWEFASDVLERYTGTGFGPALAATGAERATIQARWTAWLAANRAALHFDGAAGLWVAP